MLHKYHFLLLWKHQQSSPYFDLMENLIIRLELYSTGKLYRGEPF